MTISRFFCSVVCVAALGAPACAGRGLVNSLFGYKALVMLVNATSSDAGFMIGGLKFIVPAGLEEEVIVRLHDAGYYGYGYGYGQSQAITLNISAKLCDYLGFDSGGRPNECYGTVWVRGMDLTLQQSYYHGRYYVVYLRQDSGGNFYLSPN